MVLVRNVLGTAAGLQGSRTRLVSVLEFCCQRLTLPLGQRFDKSQCLPNCQSIANFNLAHEA